MIFGGVVGGDTPKIEFLEIFVFGVHDHLSEKGSASGKFAVIVVGGGLHIVASGVVVETEGGGDSFLVDFG